MAKTSDDRQIRIADTPTAENLEGELKLVTIRAEGRLPIQARVGVNTGEVRAFPPAGPFEAMAIAGLRAALELKASSPRARSRPGMLRATPISSWAAFSCRR